MPSSKSSSQYPSLRIFVGIVSLMVAAVVIGGIYVAGSPSASRAKILDQRRVDALSQVSSALDQYYATNFALPATLDELKNSPATNYALSSIVDPETQRPLAYRLVDAQTYELCGTFAFPSDDQADGMRPMIAKPIPSGGVPAGETMNWYTHEAGEVCQRANAAQRAPFQYCGSGVGMNVCPGGTTCTQLPGRSSALCVKTGMECAAAGCDGGQCAIDKSLPAVVHCTQPITTPENAPPSKNNDSCAYYAEVKGPGRGCYGCANGICNEPPPGYEQRGGDLKGDGTNVLFIPRSCIAAENGCMLAQ